MSALAILGIGSDLIVQSIKSAPSQKRTLAYESLMAIQSLLLPLVNTNFDSNNYKFVAKLSSSLKITNSCDYNN